MSLHLYVFLTFWGCALLLMLVCFVLLWYFCFVLFYFNIFLDDFLFFKETERKFVDFDRREGGKYLGRI